MEEPELPESILPTPRGWVVTPGGLAQWSQVRERMMLHDVVLSLTGHWDWGIPRFEHALEAGHAPSFGLWVLQGPAGSNRDVMAISIDIIAPLSAITTAL